MSLLPIKIDPLTSAAFAPFGAVIEAPSDPGRVYFDETLINRRPSAQPSVSLVKRDPSAVPLDAIIMERHPFSSQTFVALDAVSWLVLVAPHAASGGPDMAHARAFLPSPSQGITFGADVWHHPLTVFDRPGRFAIFMWRDGTTGDEEFFKLDHPVRIEVT